MRVRRGFAMLVLAVTVGAVGCSGDGSSPRSLPVVSASPSASTSATPTAAATSKTKAGLIAFVRSYYAAINEAAEIKSTAALATLSVPACECRRLVRYLNDVFRHGGSVHHFVYNIRRVYDARIRDSTGVVTVVFDVPKATVTDRQGNVTFTQAPITGETNVVTTLWQGQWLLTNDVKLGG